MIGLKKRKILTISIVFFLLLCSWVIYKNKALEVTVYEIDCSKKPLLNGFTIVQISDFHNEQFGENQQKILRKVSECKPDIIAITGDFIDCRRTNVEAAMEFAGGAVKIAPVYYVPGNHEHWARREYELLCEKMEEAGVHLMDGVKEEIFYAGEKLICMGVKDPDFYNVKGIEGEKEVIESQIEMFDYSEDNFTILLSHRPEVFDLYSKRQLDMVLTGHAHGGQFRVPFIGGIAAPNQGLFPKYDAGMFVENRTHMIVSRGIGNSIIPLRFNNPPEIVVVKLTAK